MWEFIMWIPKPIYAGAATGLLAAARVDYLAFKDWKCFNDALSYNWSIALWRWFQGAVIGAVTAAGLDAGLSYLG